MFRGGNIQGVAHLQNQNYFVTESLNVVQKVKDGNKNPKNSHNSHDENNDETELSQVNSNTRNVWHSTQEQKWGGVDQYVTLKY